MGSARSRQEPRVISGALQRITLAGALDATITSAPTELSPLTLTGTQYVCLKHAITRAPAPVDTPVLAALARSLTVTVLSRVRTAISVLTVNAVQRHPTGAAPQILIALTGLFALVGFASQILTSSRLITEQTAKGAASIVNPTSRKMVE